MTEKEQRGTGYLERLGPPAFFAVLSIATWGPALFYRGYVLLGDMVFTPAMNPGASLFGPQRGTTNVTLVYNLARLVSRLAGAMLLQKLVLFLAVFLAGYLMYRNAPTENPWARLFAGTLYSVNPFIYTRLVMGQWGFVLGYALLPAVMASTMKMMREPTADRWARTALWLAATAVLSLHAGGLGLLVFGVTGLFQLRVSPAGRRRALALVAVLVLFLVLAGFWLLPSFESGEYRNIGGADLEAFETRSTSRAGVGFSLLGMYGYWKTQIDALMPRGYVPLWPLFGIAMLLLSVYGLWSFREQPGRGREAWALAVLGVLGFVLALGSGAPVTGRLFSLVYRNVGAFRLFREPQKFAALLVLAYACLGSMGIEKIVTRRRADPARGRKVLAVASALVLVVLLGYTFRMFGGLWGHARAVSYPRSWSEASEILDAEAGDSRTLFLPPYWYMRFAFTHSDYTITSPMPLYFTVDSVKLNALVVGGVELNAGPVDRYVKAALTSGRRRGNLGAMLVPLDVEYVVFARNAASGAYGFVLEQEDLDVVRDWGDLVLLRNRARVGRLVAAPGSGGFNNWTEVGREASGGNLAGSFLPWGPATRIPAETGRAVPHRKSGCGSISATITAGAGEGTLLLAEPFDTNWRLGGKSPAGHLDLTCAFPGAAGESGRVTIEYLDPYLVAGYSLTAAGLLICLVLLVRGAYLRRRDSGRAERD